MRRLLALTAAVPLTLAVWGHAADQTILGKQIQIKDAKPGVDPTKRKIVGQGKEKTSPNTIVGDPTVGGASLFFFTTGATSGNQAFVLPTGTDPASGKPFWATSGSTGYKYKDRAGTNGPVKVAQIKLSGSGTIQVKAVLLGKNGSITLLPPNLGTSACMALKITNGDVYHVLLGADSIIKKNDQKTFQLKDAGSEGLCPLLPTCGNGIVDPGSGEQCDPAGPPTCGSCNADCTCPCDFLDPSFCMYPFPSDFLTVADSSTDTGRRVNFVNSAMPQNTDAIAIDSAPYRGNDGFSPGSSILLKVPGIDLGMTGAVPITDVERSFDADAPIVVINASTGARHLIWSELDANATTDAVRSLIIRPAVNFDEATRYIVALRNLKTAAGAVIPPNATFKAYRDGTLTSDQVVEARRPHMESIFTTLASAGIGRNDLYLAWDFTVASERNLSERLLFMRDDAFARLGSAAPAFTITSVAERGRRRHLPAGHRHLRRRTVRRFHHAPGEDGPRRQRPTDASVDAAAGVVHLQHPEGRPCQRQRQRSSGARIDLWPRAPRLELRGQQRQRPRDGQRTQLRLLRHQVDRHGGRGRRDRDRHPAGAREVPEPHRPAAAVDGEPALPRAPDDPPRRLHPTTPPSRTPRATRSSTPARSSTTATARAASSAAP